MSDLPTPLMPTASGEMSAENARLIGRELADHPLLAARHHGERPAVAEVLADARPLLSTYGVSFEILRTRPGFVVLRARTDGRVSAQFACEVVKSLLDVVTDHVCEVKASLVENTCAQRGASACLFSMMWEEPTSAHPSSEEAPAFVPLAPPPPETLLDTPLETTTWEAPARSGGWEVPPVAADQGDPIPEWDRPIAPETFVGPAEPDSTLQQAIEPAQNQATSHRRGPESATTSTASSSTGYQVQVSTPNSVVVPASSPPAPAPTEVASSPVFTGGQAVSIAVRRNFGRGLARRAWLLALALVAGSAGGWFAGVHAGTSYGAQATLLVQSGASKTGPGSANDALALATTYSAVIPKDQAILSTAGGALGMSATNVGHAISVTVETGTSILLVSFTASTPAQALKGASVVARAVASSTPLTSAIAAGSVAIVSLPTSAHKQGTLHKYGIVLGAFVGLVVGLILVLAAERADPRIDDARSMADATGCRAALVPNELSFAELARVLSDAGREKGGLTVVPIDIADTAPTLELARGLRPCWPADGPMVGISPSFSSGVVELSRGSGPTVLVSHPGARQHDVLAATERLRMIGRAPLWAVLAHRRLRSRVSDRVG